MKTDHLIAGLAADARMRHAPPARAILVAMTIGGLASLVGFLLAMGLRADLAEAFGTWRFTLKLLIVVTAVIVACIDCARVSGPEPVPMVSRSSWLVPLLVVSGVVIELSFAAVDGWRPRLVGSNASLCLAAIPLLSILPFVATMGAMRGGAPASPLIAGAAAGRLAAASGALLYALHCFDDSPLFVATWYTLATLPVIAIGAVCGRLFLRW